VSQALPCATCAPDAPVRCCPMSLLGHGVGSLGRWRLGLWFCAATCVTLCSLAVLSARWHLHAWGTVGRWTTTVGADRGGVYLVCARDIQLAPGNGPWGARAPRVPVRYGYLWWQWSFEGTVGAPGLYMAATLWPLAIPTLLAAILIHIGVRRRERAQPGQCGSCGYDLRGIARGSGCPECGAPSTDRSPA
jgi:hypothetical protein